MSVAQIYNVGLNISGSVIKKLKAHENYLSQ